MHDLGFSNYAPSSLERGFPHLSDKRGSNRDPVKEARTSVIQRAAYRCTKNHLADRNLADARDSNEIPAERVSEIARARAQCTVTIADNRFYERSARIRGRRVDRDEHADE